ncbi:40S ribosomal protein S5 [Monoraphidium neglectum]|uniref:40S ribosomal protein S5 n=1 Tax=Monoraphidium neglectum TaxID=145388 RepID=A0A0D2J2F1_9CHLO|nr:40S ribosomal protein S5 [Monoraphidium neglectum]KIY94142.1 40S ribosomal protein S5 [Monoraphidium neglectum]|eukprot:XP_013893162.1 40S ribosomal protein S5 [Monoraphidium neglectum]
MATTSSDAVEVKLFGKWSFEEVEVTDISLEDYIAVKPKFAVYVPHTAGRYQKRRFRKALCPIVERLTNSIMMHGRNNGKKLMASAAQQLRELPKELRREVVWQQQPSWWPHQLRQHQQQRLCDHHFGTGRRRQRGWARTAVGLLPHGARAAWRLAEAALDRACAVLAHMARCRDKAPRRRQCAVLSGDSHEAVAGGREWKLQAAGQRVRIVSHAFDIIHLLSDQNPIQVLVDAIINRWG